MPEVEVGDADRLPVVDGSADEETCGSKHQASDSSAGSSAGVRRSSVRSQVCADLRRAAAADALDSALSSDESLAPPLRLYCAVVKVDSTSRSSSRSRSRSG